MTATAFIPNTVIRSTEKALLVELQNGKQVWMPLSQTKEVEGRPEVLEVPSWLLAAKLGTTTGSLAREQKAVDAFSNKLRKMWK